ncbi:MAG: molybdopterin-dependent oxidoreductase, partial [Myxococcota bacterium]
MLNTYCRLCEGACGLQAEIDSSGQLAGLQGDPSDPISGGFICETAHRSLSAMRHPDRIRQPMRRVDGVLTPVDWETAIQEIGAQLRAIRGQTGPGSLGMYLGDSLFWSSQDWVRSLAFGVGLGTAAVFSELCLGAGPAARITEMAIGYPTYLLPDVGRAHAILLLGGDQRAVGWGPLIAGAAHERAIQHSRKTKGTRVVVADPRRTPLADDMDQHLAVRPGTEPFLLLGMLSAIVQGGWHDHQFVDDYTHHFERLKEAVASWPVDRCAEICGVEKSILSGVALKFSRAAMGTILPGRSAFLNANASLGAWAWMALHGVTANLLRPGGLYEHRGLVDLQPLLSTIPTDAAPRTRVGGVPLLLMQAPATLLAD